MAQRHGQADWLADAPTDRTPPSDHVRDDGPARAEFAPRAALDNATEWLHTTWHTLLDLDARIASDTATGHGRTGTVDDRLGE